MTIKRPRGTNDFLPGETVRWQDLENKLHRLCRQYGFEEIRTPIFEETELFARGVGNTSDIVQKEMYVFQDMGGRSLALRPEGTASVARAYLENKMQALNQPVKLYYLGPMFRSERPQAGRYHQFHQFGLEIFGSNSYLADAEVICFAWDFYTSLGLSELDLHLNSVGCPKCRPLYRQSLQEFLAPQKEQLCTTCRERFERNPLRILDCKSPICRELSVGAPVMLDQVCPECEEHFRKVRKTIDEAGIPYILDDRLVRGLDYYTKTAFEIQIKGIGAQSAVCGGGRYDGLIEEFGGPAIPGVGFALGLERIFLALESQGIGFEKEPQLDIFIATMGEAACGKAFTLAQELRQKNLSVQQDLLGKSLKSQLKSADKQGARFVIIIGEDELQSGLYQVRDMAESFQELVPDEDLLSFFCDKLGK
ncbi:MAG: histidine--tRNA ligase [Clostridiales bacterium]|jgi:histidyl-tRNA synthetase|nr:histidine--tRNA ligase [Clostridiales bacterium]